MNEKFDRKSAESTKLMKFGRQVESSALNAMVNVSFRSSSSNGRNDQLAGACEAPCSTRVGGASFFKNWKLTLRSGRWRGHVSSRPDRLCGQFEQLARIFVSDAAAGSWLAASNFPKFENNSADRPQMTEFAPLTHRTLPIPLIDNSFRHWQPKKSETAVAPNHSGSANFILNLKKIA